MGTKEILSQTAKTSEALHIQTECGSIPFPSEKLIKFGDLLKKHSI